jgi:sec-independent protein translocase protein TatA
MPGWFGPWELLIVLAIVLLIFGPKRLPSLGRSLGQGARSFRDSVRGRFDKNDDGDDEEPAQLTPGAAHEPKREKESSREKEPV